MSEKRRKFEPKSPSSASADTGATGRPRSRSAATAGQDSGGLLQRYRSVLIGAIVIAVVGVGGLVVFQSASTSAYTCDELLSAPREPIEQAADQLGFIVPDAGRSHSNSNLRYATCPPTSGDHRAGGALPRRFYGPSAIQVPNDWVHNLEHGYAVIAYSGDPGARIIDQIKTAMDSAPPSDVATACELPNKVIALRFDEMSEPFAVLAWDRALLMDTFDPALVAAAVEQFQDQPQAPERAC